MTLNEKSFENIVGKGENAGNQHFLLFPTMFYSYQRKMASFVWKINAFNMDMSIFLLCGKEEKQKRLKNLYEETG